MVDAKLVNMPRGRPAENPAECGIKVAEAARLINVVIDRHAVHQACRRHEAAFRGIHVGGSAPPSAKCRTTIKVKRKRLQKDGAAN